MHSVTPSRPFAATHATHGVETNKLQHKQHAQQEQQQKQGEVAENDGFPSGPLADRMHLILPEPSLQAQAQAAPAAPPALNSAQPREQGAMPDMHGVQGAALTSVIPPAKNSHHGQQPLQVGTLTSNGSYGMAPQLKPPLRGMPSSVKPLTTLRLDLPHELPISMRGPTWSRPHSHTSRTLAMADEMAQGINGSATCLLVVTYHATRAGARPGRFKATLDMQAAPEVSQTSSFLA